VRLPVIMIQLGFEILAI